MERIVDMGLWRKIAKEDEVKTIVNKVEEADKLKKEEIKSKKEEIKKVYEELKTKYKDINTAEIGLKRRDSKGEKTEFTKIELGEEGTTETGKLYEPKVAETTKTAQVKTKTKKEPTLETEPTAKGDEELTAEKLN